MEHTKEPWATDYRKRPDGMCAQEIFDTATGETIATMSWHPMRNGLFTSTNREENARRIVACVNACAGIPTKRLEDPESDQAKLTKKLFAEWKQLEMQRDKLMDELEKFTCGEGSITYACVLISEIKAAQ